MKLFVSCIIFLVFFAGCSRPGKEEGKGRIEISPYKITEVILKDTMQVKTAYTKCDSGRATMYDFSRDYCNPQVYLNMQQFSEFQKAVWTLVRQPKSRVYKSIDGPAMTTKELRLLFRRCDSLEQISYDPKGNEVSSTVFVCDSTSLPEQINKIVFYESWYFNPANNMIERDLLGYSVMAYMTDKEAWRELFVVMRDEEAIEKLKKYW